MSAAAELRSPMEIARDVRDLADRIAGQFVREEVENAAATLGAEVEVIQENALRTRSELVLRWLGEFLRALGGEDAEALAHAGHSLVTCTENLRGLIAHEEVRGSEAA